MNYFILSVDYMVAKAEEIMARTVKSRFHDWFIYENSTTSLSPYHLQKLIEDYNIFEHCAYVDSFAFLIDWVINGKTEEHEELARKILDGTVAPIRYDESESDDWPQSDDNQEGDDRQHSDDKQESDDRPHSDVAPETINNKESQNNGEPQCDNHKQTDEVTHTNNDVREESMGVNNDCHPQSKDDPQAKIDQVFSENPLRDKEYGINNVDAKGLERIGNDILETLQKIKRKLESTNCSPDFVDKCNKEIDYLYFQQTNCTQHNETNASCEKTETLKQQMIEPHVEHVLIAIAPKKVLKDFHKEFSQYDDTEITDSPNEAIFDICIYNPQTLTWLYFGEGKHRGPFRKMGREGAASTLNYCMLDNLFFVSKNKSRVDIFSLKMTIQMESGPQ